MMSGAFQTTTLKYFSCFQECCTELRNESEECLFLQAGAVLYSIFTGPCPLTYCFLPPECVTGRTKWNQMKTHKHRKHNMFQTGHIGKVILTWCYVYKCVSRLWIKSGVLNTGSLWGVNFTVRVLSSLVPTTDRNINVSNTSMHTQVWIIKKKKFKYRNMEGKRAQNGSTLTK